MRKKIFIIFILLIGIATAHYVGAGEQIWDWAWSDSIGWVSFRNDNANAHWDRLNANDNIMISQPNNAFRKDMYKIEDPPLGISGSITAVRLRARYSGEIRLGVRLYGSESWSATDSRSSEGPSSWRYFYVRPDNGTAWSWDAIEDLQVGLEVRRGSGSGEVDQLEVYIDYSGGSEQLELNGTGDYTNVANPAPAAPYGYGVEADRETGALSGYAWSSNIGWISFEPSSVSGCPDTLFIPNPQPEPCQTYIDFDTAYVYGWARACSVFSSGCSGSLKLNLGGWEGWIKFDGSDSDYMSYLDDTLPTDSEFKQWAWGDNVVIGWLSLNKSNTAGPIDYKVKTKLKLNIPPVASFVCEDCFGSVVSPCETYLGTNLCLINYSADEDGTVVLSRWYRDGVEEFSCVGICDNTYGGVRGQWQVKLYVEDDKGASDETPEQQVTVLRDLFVSFQCSLDETNWYSCTDSDNISVVEGDTLHLRDTSTPSESFFDSVEGVHDFIVQRKWYVNNFNFANDDEIVILPEDITVPTMIFRLWVKDSNGHEHEVEQTLVGILPLPTWREIAPF